MKIEARHIESFLRAADGIDKERLALCLIALAEDIWFGQFPMLQGTGAVHEALNVVARFITQPSNTQPKDTPLFAESQP